jgi:cytochrome c2
MANKKRLTEVLPLPVLLLALVLAYGFATELKAASQDDSAERGKAIFAKECSFCHTIGEGRKVGADLKEVTKRRPREWLISFISDPERMAEQGDPTTKKLVQQHGGIRMSSEGLSEQEVSNVLAYLESKGGPSRASTEWGRSTFERKCSICHTIGGGNKIGPDLKGITNTRSSEWLIRFISDPEKMYKEGDLAAVKLRQQYKGMKMPTLKLTEQELSNILAYLKSKDAPSAPTRKEKEGTPR